MGGKKVPSTTPPTNSTPFRNAERLWKARSSPLNLDLAFDPLKIEWKESATTDGRREGCWRDGNGKEIVCNLIRMGKMEGMGQTLSRKGKEKEQEIEWDYAIILPAFPGLVILPFVLPPSLQQSLTVESLRSSVLPNLTSLSPHYDLPKEGLWNAWEQGRSSEVVHRIDGGVIPPDQVGARKQVDFEPVTESNWTETLGRGERMDQKVNVRLPLKEKVIGGDEVGEKEQSVATVSDLLPKLRWTTIGYSYDWTSKTYDFSRPMTPLPPLIYRCCKSIARSVPWDQVFHHPDDANEKTEWSSWSEDYEPEAGVINFYQNKDSLTAHIDQSEVSPTRPLVSLSLGASAIFLIGGPTRESEPILPLILRSGDGLIMSGKEGRRVFHGLPRVLEGTVPDHLKANPDEYDDAGCTVKAEEWKLFGEYLEKGARINLNVREVFDRS